MRLFRYLVPNVINAHGFIILVKISWKFIIIWSCLILKKFWFKNITLVMTLWNFCINICNWSSVAWCLPGKQRNVKDLITSFCNTGINVYRCFAHLMKKSLIFPKSFLYSEVPMMSLSLAYYLVIVLINILLKSIETTGSSRSILLLISISRQQSPQDQYFIWSAHHLILR